MTGSLPLFHVLVWLSHVTTHPMGSPVFRVLMKRQSCQKLELRIRGYTVWSLGSWVPLGKFLDLHEFQVPHLLGEGKQDPPHRVIVKVRGVEMHA